MTGRIALALAGIASLMAIAWFSGEVDKKTCETDIAQRFHTEATYWRGQCIVKGYGKVPL